MRKIAIATQLGCFLAIGLAAQSIQVTSPAAGTVWPLNSLQTITWIKSGTMDDRVFIRLYRDMEPVQYISEDTENDGSFPWTVPGTLAAGSYTLRVRTLDRAVKGDSSAFSIGSTAEEPPSPAPPRLEVSQPNGGEEIRFGTGVTIRWQASGLPAEGLLDVSLLKGRKEIATLATGVKIGAGQFFWPSGKIEPKKLPTGKDYKILLRVHGRNLIDASDHSFAIVVAEPAGPAGDLELKRLWADTEGNVRIAVSSTFSSLERRLAYEIRRPVWAPSQVERKAIDLDFNAPGEKEYVLERVLATDLDMRGNDIIHSSYMVRLDPDNALRESNESNNRKDAALCGHAFFPVIEKVIIGGVEVRTRNQTAVIREESLYHPSDNQGMITTSVVVRNYGYAPHEAEVNVRQIGHLPQSSGSGPGGAPLQYQNREVFGKSCYMRLNEAQEVTYDPIYYLYPTDIVAEIVWDGPGARTHMAKFSFKADFSQLRRD